MALRIPAGLKVSRHQPPTDGPRIRRADACRSVMVIERGTLRPKPVPFAPSHGSERSFHRSVRCPRPLDFLGGVTEILRGPQTFGLVKILGASPLDLDKRLFLQSQRGSSFHSRVTDNCLS